MTTKPVWYDDRNELCRFLRYLVNEYSLNVRELIDVVRSPADWEDEHDEFDLQREMRRQESEFADRIRKEASHA